MAKPLPKTNAPAFVKNNAIFSSVSVAAIGIRASGGINIDAAVVPGPTGGLEPAASALISVGD